MLQTEQILQDRYQLQQQLGNNAGRQTWLAQDISTSTGELAIVKLLAFSPHLQWDDFKLFEREAQVLQKLTHPRIPRYRDYFSLDKQMGEGLCWFGLVQEYIPGKSLQQALDSGQRFSESQVKAIATQILEILIYLHEGESPVIHRDIKPSNIILGEDDKVYLVDFGAVQDTAAAAGATFTIVGTTGYAPLEQFWGKAVPASDLYALGATLVHLLTGICPADLPQHNLRIQFKDKVSIREIFLNWIEALIEPSLEQRVSRAKVALENLKTGRVIVPLMESIPLSAYYPFTLKKSPTVFLIILSPNPLSQLIIFAAKIILMLIIGLILFVSFFILPALVTALISGIGFFMEVIKITISLLLIVFWVLTLREWVYLCKDIYFPSLSVFHIRLDKMSQFLTLTIAKNNQIIQEEHKISPTDFSVNFKNRNLLFNIKSRQNFGIKTNLSRPHYQLIARQVNSWLENI
ncbi:serine/threonine protein kinase [Laspinema sp. A4]|uniref:serine/threonine protein kinase n=1 Tax=Laspinema sp. D2d TaxID=2953686 RepID=UPI0021BBA2F9|nr:serine/threonine-protein kinase [Laspinema sp. D2d]MCT7984241.1 serine/threonine protein kinase [Laspinema sp. D2d]